MTQPTRIDLAKWSLCTACSCLPFLLFILVFWFFAIGKPELESVWMKLLNADDPLVAHKADNLRIAVLNYASHIFVHLSLCIAAVLFYCMSLWRQGSVLSGQRAFRLGFVGLYALGLCFAISLLTLTDTYFSRLVIAPFGQFFKVTGLDQAFLPLGLEGKEYLGWAVLIPTLPGTIAAAFASGAFHQMVFLRKSAADADSSKRRGGGSIPVLRLQATILSVVLVSSVVTARAYFHLFPPLVRPDLKAEHQLLHDLATTLSTASGLLFTLTLALVFAPGIVVMIGRYLVPKAGFGSEELSAAYQSFKSGTIYAQFRTILQTVLTLVAPALASPLLEIISSL